MSDRYERHIPSLSDPAALAFEITPSDVDLAVPTKAIYVGGMGNVVVVAVQSDSAVTFASVPAGTILPVRAKRVTSATTATDLVGLTDPD